MTLTQTNAAVLQQVAQVVKHGALILSANAAEVTQETTAVGHHLGESDLLEEKKRNIVTSVHEKPEEPTRNQDMTGIE